MGNIFDYLIWRGDLSFSAVPFNEIDNLICSRISYLPLEKVLSKNTSLTIKEIQQKKDKLKKYFIMKEDEKLLDLLSKSNRYKDLYLENFISHTNLEEEKQFAVVTITLPDNYLYISFRGTDNTFVGWKEDFNMTFLKQVPSQIEAVNYLNNLKTNIKTKLYIGGHSKGGNLAMYASMNANNNIKRKIINIYNNDGPGFLEEVINTKEYKMIEDKIKTFIPQSSVIGRLLNSNNIFQVIKSDEVLLMQHDLYSWQLCGSHFTYLENVNFNSEFIKEVMNDWLHKMTKAERENFVEVLYKLLTSTKTTTFKQFDKQWFSSIKSMISTYYDLDKEDKKMVIKILDYLYESIKETSKKQKSKA